MPQITPKSPPHRHVDVVVRPGSVPRVPLRRRTVDAATVARAMPQAVGETFDRLLPPIMDAISGLDRALDRRNARIVDARARAIVDRIHAYAAVPASMSSTAGFVRDAQGKRLRPLTGADLNAINDRHFGRTRP